MHTTTTSSAMLSVTQSNVTSVHAVMSRLVFECWNASRDMLCVCVHHNSNLLALVSSHLIAVIAGAAGAVSAVIVGRRL
jgi:hypothetical protein